MLQVQMFSDTNIAKVVQEMNEWLATNNITGWVHMESRQSEASGYYGCIYTLTVWYRK